MKNTDIIIFTILRSDLPYSSTPLFLARELSNQNRVFYINFPLTWSDALKDKNNRNFSLKEQEIAKNLTVINPPNILPVNWLSAKNYEKINQINQHTIKKSLNYIIQKYNIQQYIYINCFSPFLMPVSTAKLRPLLNFYYCVDEISTEPYIAKHGVRLEAKASILADVVLCTSLNLLNKKKDIAKKAYLLANAADNSNFERVFNEKFEKPIEIKHINTPIIGFVGNLDPTRIDYVLLKKIAEKHSDKTLVLIGPQSSERYKEFGLDKMSNIIFTGSKPVHELPSFFQYFDCGIIPFDKNEQTKSIYPLKINEYLAAGLPVVSTKFSLDILDFDTVAYLAESHQDFIELIDKAIAEKSNKNLLAQRIDKAKQNTWAERATMLWKIVGENS